MNLAHVFPGTPCFSERSCFGAYSLMLLLISCLLYSIHTPASVSASQLLPMIWWCRCPGHSQTTKNIPYSALRTQKASAKLMLLSALRNRIANSSMTGDVAPILLFVWLCTNYQLEIGYSMKIDVEIRPQFEVSKSGKQPIVSQHLFCWLQTGADVIYIVTVWVSCLLRLNPLRAKFGQVRQERTYSTWPISWLLMSWRRKEPGHQQPWYWPS